jgi:peptidyl-prolyl cis-trans isomerase D
LTTERAQEQATRVAEQLDAEIDSPDDLDRVAKARGLKVQESGFFTQTEPVMGLGYTPQASSMAFILKDGQVSDAIKTAQGHAFITVSGKQDSYIPKLDDVKEQVREDIKQSRAADAAKKKADEMLAALRSAADFTAAAKAAGVEAKATELIARGSAIGEAGVSPEIEKIAFSLPVGSVSDAIVTNNGAAIVKVVERKDVTPQEIASGRDTLREELLNQERARFFASYMEKAKEKMSIEIYQETLQRVIA